jgi:hypothetical protein
MGARRICFAEALQGFCKAYAERGAWYLARGFSVVFSMRGKRKNAEKDGKAEKGRGGGGAMRLIASKCLIHAVESGARPHEYGAGSELKAA